jgi:peptidoglycan/xylan/chitin deacetylase (PgdA/CDA1 family)
MTAQIRHSNMGAPLRHWVLRGVAAGVCVLGVLLDRRLPLSLSARLLVLACSVALAGAAAFRFVPAFDPKGRVRWRLPRSAARQKQVALTFDDGPTASTAEVLDILAREAVRATFFVLGSHAARRPDLVRRAADAGHAVGIHGLTHAKLSGATREAIEAEIGGATEGLARIGVEAAPVIRTPHGFKSARVLAAARRHGLTMWAWTRGVWDTDRPAPPVIARRATRFARPGMVLLLHDGRGDEIAPDVTPMLQALPLIIAELRRRGFTFVTLADV